jgi:predicted nucleic acid-binding protein
MSNPGYSRKMRFTPGDLIGRLRQFVGHSDHEFWPDGISLRDATLFATDRLHSSRQLTDLYLLALAVSRQGRLVTFDQSIPLSAVPSAQAANLCAA